MKYMLMIGSLMIAMLAQAGDYKPKDGLERIKESLTTHTKQKAADYVLVGDMMLPRKQSKTGAIEPNLWPGEVFYSLQEEINESQRQVWRDSAAEWNKVTGIVFTERTNQENYINVILANFNASYIGMVGGPQTMWIQDWTSTTVIHEIGHALGLLHEQSRYDRDDYVSIDFDHVTPGQEHNFRKAETQNYTAYDFRSIMHYGSRAFSVDGRATIVPQTRYNDMRNIMGNGLAPSEGDKGGMAALYGQKSDDHGNSFELATQWEIAQATSGQLEYSVDLDTLYFDLEANSSLSITASGPQGFVVRLFNRYGGLIQQLEGSEQPFVLSENLSAGRYHVKVFSNDFEEGAWQLSAATTPWDGGSEVNIVDETLEALLIAEFDTNGDGVLSLQEAQIPGTIEIYNEPVRGLAGLEAFSNLTTLVAFDTLISDFSAVTNLPRLEYLIIIYSRVTDMVPLDNMTSLHYIDFTNNKISDLSSLGTSSSLTSLYLSGNQIRDLTPLASLTNLRDLDIRYNPVNDLTPLKDLSFLETLNLNNNPVDLATLSQLTSLTALGIANIPIEDTTPLMTLTKMASLALSNNGLSNLGTLGELPLLTYLGMAENSASDISTLSNATNLRSLEIYASELADLQPLKDLTKLDWLIVNDGQVSDLTPLSGLPLNVVILTENQVTDLAPLVANGNLNDGDYLDVGANQLTAEQCSNIEQLQGRGVTVEYVGQADGALPCKVVGPPVDGTRWIPHVTSSSGGFQTLVTFVNTYFQDGAATLRAYDTSGAYTDHTIEVPVGTHATWRPEELTNGAEISHFEVATDQGIFVTASFRVTLDKVGGTAHVTETSDIGRRFIMYPGEWNTIWDGMAMVNLGDEAAEVTAVAIDGDGAELGRVVLTDALAPKTKLLTVLSTLFDDHPGQRIEIRASEEAVVMFLRGSAVEGPSYLYQTQPIVTY